MTKPVLMLLTASIILFGCGQQESNKVNPVRVNPVKVAPINKEECEDNSTTWAKYTSGMYASVWTGSLQWERDLDAAKKNILHRDIYFTATQVNNVSFSNGITNVWIYYSAESA